MNHRTTPFSPNTLPSDVRPELRAALESAGVTFGQPVPDRPELLHATLPPNWQIVEDPDFDDTWAVQDDIGHQHAWIHASATGLRLYAAKAR